MTKHLRRAQIADLTGLSLATVDRALADGRRTRGGAGLWPQIKLGRALLVPERAVMRWLRRAGAVEVGP